MTGMPAVTARTRILAPKTCPFCAMIPDHLTFRINPEGAAVLICNQCGAAGPPGHGRVADSGMLTGEELRCSAVLAWNDRRTSP